MKDAMKTKKQDLKTLLEEWSLQYGVFAPSMTSGRARMSPWDGKDDTFLEWYDNTVTPGKYALLPPVEEMFSFTKDGQSQQINPPAQSEQKRLLFGVRPCDAHAFTMLDKVFLNDCKDPYFANKRQHTLVAGLACHSPAESCFCTSVGGGPADTKGMDILVTDIGHNLLIEGITKVGKELVATTKSLSNASSLDAGKAKKIGQAAAKKITRQVNTEGIREKLQAIFEDKDYWQKVAAKCISCGVCTLLCPTCYCFDINDEQGQKGSGTRCRSLDSCSFDVYTKMPMENPRAEKWRRVRNKLCHKYEFYPMLFDEIACTGCGRCIRLCPVNWDITRVLESVPELTESANDNR